jgi:aminoglycoside phosphotransferase (APT) family kinase protein
MSDAALGSVLDVLVDAGRLGRRDLARDWTLRQLAGGWSRHTLLVSAGEPVAGEAFVVRVKPPGALLETDLVREYRLYTELARSDVPVPTPYGVDPAADTPLGGPYFVMDWLPGTAPNTWQRKERAELERDWAEGGRLGTELVETVSRIHAMPTAELGFLGPPRSFAACVAVWQEVYEKQRLVRDPVVEETIAWLRDREPDPVPPALVHGDYRIGNTMVDDGRITGVVDWELAYLGDPRYDLGYVSLDYLAGKFVHPGSALLGAVADRDWFFAEYERRAGVEVDREVVRTYSAMGALALICILLTGIRMYVDGATTDVRMAWNRYAVPGLRQDLIRLMEW